MLNGPSAGEYGKEGTLENLQSTARVWARDEVGGLFKLGAFWLKNGIGSDRSNPKGDDEPGGESRKRI